MTVLEYLRENNIWIESPCGGNGTCGKCLVEVKDENDGYSLHKACKITYKEGMEVRVPDSASKMTVLSYNGIKEPSGEGKNNTSVNSSKSLKYGIAIDVGTTTIAGVLTEINNDCDEGVITDTVVANSGRIFGSDVISRVKAATEGKSSEITRLLRQDISNVISDLIMKSGVKEISCVCIAANTVMSHFIMNFDVSGLGYYPYKTVDIDFITTDLGSITEDLDFLSGTPVYIMPGMSAFVGGDILSGIFACGFDVEKENTLFLDLGTNGEMAVCYNGVILCASTSAGPVFEGSSISCGMAGTEGAIHSFNIDNMGNFTYKTIHNLPPKGICGSGIIEICAELLKAGKISSEGNLEHTFRIARKSNGSYIEITQEDIRQVQLAKAAIKTGVDILLQKVGCSYEEIDRVYIAGGFGYSIDIKKAAVIGMIPEQLAGKTKAVGNSSLMGAVRFICGNIEENKKRLEDIRGRCSYIDLAMEDEFQSRYINELNFR